MAAEFHLFSALPTELRHEIWNLAIRPKEPGVHVFRVYGDYWNHQAPEVARFSYHEYRFPGHEALGLAVPLPHEESACANRPSAKSMSTYMIDMGLWTACRESMAMMRKAFPRPRSIKFGRYRFPEPVMGYYISGGAPLYFSIYPVDDLLILRSDNSEFHLEKEVYALNFHLSRIGIEYESDWEPQLYDYNHDRGECLAFDGLSDLFDTWHFSGLWLVDYNLKRKANTPPCDSLFYAGDRRLIPVDLSDENDRNHWECIEPVPDKDEKSSFAFAKQLRAYYKKLQQRHEFPCGPSIGLLGWDNY